MTSFFMTCLVIKSLLIMESWSLNFLDFIFFFITQENLTKNLMNVEEYFNLIEICSRVDQAHVIASKKFKLNSVE